MLTVTGWKLTLAQPWEETLSFSLSPFQHLCFYFQDLAQSSRIPLATQRTLCGLLTPTCLLNALGIPVPLLVKDSRAGESVMPSLGCLALNQGLLVLQGRAWWVGILSGGRLCSVTWGRSGTIWITRLERLPPMTWVLVSGGQCWSFTPLGGEKSV